MNIIGSVEGKTCILIDDMIDTAQVQSVMRRMPLQKQVLLKFMQAVLTLFIRTSDGQHPKSAIKKLVVLDTIYLPEDRLIDKIEQISIAKLLAEAIVRIHENRPLPSIGNLKCQVKMLTIRRLGNWPLLFRRIYKWKSENGWKI